MTSTPSPIKPPSWLDPKTKIVTSDQPPSYVALDDKRKAIVFIMISFCSLASLSKTISHDQIISVIANSIVETGWGRKWKGWNFGGWKINKSDVDAFKAQNNGVCPPWWEAPGHVKSGDPEMCYYRGFPGPRSYYDQWLKRFVPKQSNESHRYHKTGAAFWDNKDWFPELIQAGYKGAVTKANPKPSIDSHELIVHSVKNRLGQMLLGLDPDGSWGSKSKAACESFQRVHSINPTGNLDERTLNLLLSRWEASGFSIPYVKMNEIPLS